MAVTVDDIAIELGRPTPVENSLDWDRWSRWIARAYRAIEARCVTLGKEFSSLDEDTVDDVVTYAVIRRIGLPVDGAESITEQAAVDDGSVSETRRYPSTSGDLFFFDNWWAMLGLVRREGRVGSMRLGVPSWRLPREGL